MLRPVLARVLPAVLLTGVLAVPTAHAATMYPSGVGADLGPTPTTLGIQPAAGDDPAGLRTGTEPAPATSSSTSTTITWTRSAPTTSW
jgi:hypothetical protein